MSKPTFTKTLNDFSELGGLFGPDLNKAIKISYNGITINGERATHYKGQRIEVKEGIGGWSCEKRSVKREFATIAYQMENWIKNESKDLIPLLRVKLDALYVLTASNRLSVLGDKIPVEKDVISGHDGKDKFYWNYAHMTIEDVPVEIVHDVFAGDVATAAERAVSCALYNTDMLAVYRAYDLMREYYRKIGQDRMCVIAYGQTP